MIKNVDMKEEMQQDAIAIAEQALGMYTVEKDIAAHIKKEFDKKYNPTWHCIVGRNFGSYVTHEVSRARRPCGSAARLMPRAPRCRRGTSSTST